MAKRKKKVPYLGPWIKKSSIAVLIAALVAVISQFAEGIHQKSQVELPASEQPVALYSNQTKDDLRQVFLKAIESAHESIYIVIYELSDHVLVDALQRKCEEGVKVYIVSDAKASQGLSRKLKCATVIRRVANGLTHQKILVIDHSQVWIGSANYTMSSLDIHGNLVNGLNHPALAKFLIDKIIAMDEEGGGTSTQHSSTQAGGQNIEVWPLPDDPQAAKRVLQLLQGAKKSIKVAMYTWTRTDFAEALIAAAKRGIRVEVVLDRYAGKGASAKIARLLTQGQIPVRLSTGKGLLHHKFAYIDGQILINGSANWTYAAFKDNDDIFMVIYPLTQPQIQKMDALWQVIWQQSAVATE